MQSRFAAKRFLARITQSDYKNEMVLKGGYLIGAMVGLGNRSTHDLDYSYQKKVPVDQLQRIVTEVAQIDLKDGTHFNNISVDENANATERYNPGYRVSMDLEMANPDPSKPNKPVTYHLGIDLATNDDIIPNVQRFNHTSEIDGSKISVYAYPIEQILAEKMSACFNHGDQDTRVRDFYDLYALKRFEGESIDNNSLRASIKNQLKIHNQYDALENPIAAFNDLRQSLRLQKVWNDKRQQIIPEGQEITFDQTINAANNLLRNAGFKDTAPRPKHRPWLSQERPR